MELGMIFNELSIESPAPDKKTACQWMTSLLDTIRVAVRRGVKRELRTDIELNSAFLAENYPLARWRNDKQVDMEQRRYFRTLVTRYPPIDDLPEIKEKTYFIDFKYYSKKAKGLGIAYLLDGLAISFQSASQWNINQLPLSSDTLDESGEIGSRPSKNAIFRHNFLSAFRT